LWGAGVKASPLGKALGVETDGTGRVPVDEFANVSGHRDVFVIGDLAAFKQGDGYLAGVAPVAIQMRRYVAETIKRDVEKRARKLSHYLDKGTMATIGRSKAIAQIGKTHLSRLSAWAAWLFVHILLFVGFRNRLAVLPECTWSYFTVE